MRHGVPAPARLAEAAVLLLAVGLLFVGVTVAVAALVAMTHLGLKASGVLGVAAATGISMPVAGRVTRKLSALADRPRRPSASDVELPVPGEAGTRENSQ